MVAERVWTLWGVSVLSVGLWACQGSPDTTKSDTASVGPTWHQDIAPYVALQCAGCHNNDDNFAFPLTTFEESAPLASWMLEKMEGSDSPPYFMPPFAARDSDTCEPPALWKSDPRPTLDELEVFRAWVDAGTPEGDPATASTLVAPQQEELMGADVQRFTLPARTLAEGSYDDEYHCYPIDLGLDREAWIDALDVLPDNTDVVHHVLLFTDPNQDGRERAGDADSYPCFGGTGLPNSGLAYSWAPGLGPLDLGGEAGVRIPAGGGLIAQVHYHPTGEVARDASSVVIRYAEERPARTAEFRVLGGATIQQADSSRWEDPPFSIPSGATQHNETWVEPLEVPNGAEVRLASVFPHMHLAGTSIHVSIERDGEEICLASLPAWDFEWQRSYEYEGAFDELPKLESGDKIRIECTYNNSVSNPILMQYSDPASIQDIVVGENSLDEMCVAIVGIHY